MEYFIRIDYEKIFIRLSSISYGASENEKLKYDTWGRLIERSKNGLVSKFKYDHFGRLVEKFEGGTLTKYTYDNFGKRLSRITTKGGEILDEYNTYDKFGRLVKTQSNGKIVEYIYNKKNQLAEQIIDGNKIVFEYTKLGQLSGKTLLDKDGKTLSELKYFYSPSGKIISRLANGKLQEYKYDARSQLIAVIDAESRLPVESYAYDPSGNILQKTVRGETTTYAYDDANQLLSSTNPEGDITSYAYDAAGRLVKEGEKTYEYGWLDKVMRVAEDGKELARFEYHNNNQLAKVVRENGIETFEWDGLALTERNGTKYINEPHAGGGNPILATTPAPNANSITSPSQSQTIFTDMLGTSLGTVKNNAYSEIEKTAFGNLFSESAQLAKSLSSANTFFTGKPYIQELGYAFLFRNYRPDMGKWLSQDLIGYPDGWNDLAYYNNHILECVDYNGLWTVQIGVTLSGGSLLGGSISFGITIGHSTESGYTAGFYSSVSGGMDAGYSIGASITGTHTGYGSIDALSGTAVSVGGSLGLKLGAGFNIGGEANIPSEAKTFDPFGYSINVGFSIGVPVEIHSMITETVIHKLIDTGGTVTSIKE